MASVGAAAGIAGAFNAPVAAVLFVIEVVIGSWTAGMLGTVVLGAILSVSVVRYFLGTQGWIHLSPIVVGNSVELIGYVALGIVGSLASVALVRSMIVARTWALALPQWTYCLQVGTAGLVLGVIAYLGFPQILGTGYSFISASMSGQFGWMLLLWLVVLKLLTSTLSFAARTPGGIIAPTLFVGAILGCSIGGLEHSLTAYATASASAYALIGICVLFAGVLGAPLTAVVLVAELSGSYSIIVPAILAMAVASLLWRTIKHRSLLELLRAQDGMCLPILEEKKAPPTLQVQDAMQAPSFPVVDSCLTLQQAWRDIAAIPGELIFVRRGDASWTIIDRQLLDRLEATSDRGQRLENMIDNLPMPRLYPDLPLDTTLRHLHRWPVLPVVRRANIGSLAGVITMEDVLARYRHDSDGWAQGRAGHSTRAALRA
jgi:CIC family chloride channel protein